MSEENAKPEASEGLSDAEMAYFQSSGEAEIKEDVPQPEPEQQAAAVEGQEGQEPASEDQQVRDEKGRFVPHGALHAEREEHKKTKAQLEELSRFKAVMEDRWNTLLTATKQEPSAQAEQAPPDPNEDIFAFTRWQKEQMDRLQQRLDQQDQQRQELTQAQAEEREIATTWQSSVQEFQTKQTDFPDAANYLAGLRSQQLAALGLDTPQINATIDAELKGVIKQAKALNRSPAEIIYQYATVSGYKPTPAEQEQQRVQQMPESLARVAAAQEASRTIAGDGKGVHDPDSPEAIASMSDREFSAWMNDPANQRRFERMMGG